jgi:hypothetical protein
MPESIWSISLFWYVSVGSHATLLGTHFLYINQDSSESKVSGYGLDYQGSIPSKTGTFLLVPLCPEQLWDPQSLLSNVYQGSFSQGKPYHSPPPSAALKVTWKLNSTLLHSSYMLSRARLPFLKSPVLQEFIVFRY